MTIIEKIIAAHSHKDSVAVFGFWSSFLILDRKGEPFSSTFILCVVELDDIRYACNA